MEAEYTIHFGCGFAALRLCDCIAGFQEEAWAGPK
jgi:hypothetical protein